MVDPASVEAEPEGRPEEADLAINPGFSAGDAYLIEVNGTEYRYVVGTDDNISAVQDGLYQLLIAGNPGVSIVKIGTNGLRLTGTGYQILRIKLKYEGQLDRPLPGNRQEEFFLSGIYLSPVWWEERNILWAMIRVKKRNRCPGGRFTGRGGGRSDAAQPGSCCMDRVSVSGFASWTILAGGTCLVA